MSDDSDSMDIQGDLLRRLQDARRDFYIALTLSTTAARERVLAPGRLLRTIHEHVARSSTGTPHERCTRLFTLAVLLYGALDWHHAREGIDLEKDVQLQRTLIDRRHGDRDANDPPSAEDWCSRLQSQLERQLSCEESYGARLVSLTALTQSALEAAYRQSRKQ